MSMAIVCYGTVYRHTINTNNIYLLTVLSTVFVGEYSGDELLLDVGGDGGLFGGS